jgi:hypothetical protein
MTVGGKVTAKALKDTMRRATYQKDNRRNNKVIFVGGQNRWPVDSPP